MWGDNAVGAVTPEKTLSRLEMLARAAALATAFVALILIIQPTCIGVIDMPSATRRISLTYALALGVLATALALLLPVVLPHAAKVRAVVAA
jgi:hypothetical protein